MPVRVIAVVNAGSTKFSMKSVSFDGVAPVAPGGIRPGPLSSVVWDERLDQSRISTWSPGAVYRGDDLPGVPLDCFTSSMIDDGSDPSWVPYEHQGCDPVFSPVEEFSESCSGSEEEPEPMEVDQD